MAKSGRKANSAEAQLDIEEQIRQRAYEIYQQRGGADGNHIEDWLAAERELRETQAEKAAA